MRESKTTPNPHRFTEGEQPCQKFEGHRDEYYGSMIRHQCPVCEEGTRVFCTNCHTDHHNNGGWGPCWEIRKAKAQAKTAAMDLPLR